MEWRVPLLILVAILTSYSLSCYAAPSSATITLRKRIEVFPGYAVANSTVVLNGTLDELTFEIPEGGEVLYACAVLEDGTVVPAKIGESEISVDVPPGVQTLRLVEFYRIGISAAENNVSLALPLIISPKEGATDVYLSVDVPTEAFEIVAPTYLNRSGSVVFLNATGFEPGRSDVLKLAVEPGALRWVVPERLERTILVEATGRVVLVDEFLLTNVAGGAVEEVEFKLPANASVLEVEGALGPYTGRGGAGSYRTRARADYLVLQVDLRAPPKRVGERAYIRISYEVPPERGDGVLVLPAFHSDGMLIEDYEIRLKIEGSGKLVGLKPVSEYDEGDYHVLVLPRTGLLLDGVPGRDPSIELEASLNLLAEYKPYLIVAVSAALLIACLAILYRVLPRKRVEEAKREVLVAGIPAEIREELVSVYEKKLDLFEYVLRAKEERADGKISRREYRQRMERARRRRASLDERLREVRARAEEALGARLEVLDEISEIEREIDSKLAQLSVLEDERRRGRIELAKYRERRRELKREIEALCDLARSKIASIE